MRAARMATKNPAALLAMCALLIALTLALTSCSDRNAFQVLERVQMFSLGYGVLEDQINLFNLPDAGPPLPISLAMRDGIFFISNGNAAKLLTLSSFGDILSMVYNPERNPKPSILSEEASGQGLQGRVAKAYPFNEPGIIAVDSKRTVFVQDRVPDERRSYDTAAEASLDYMVLRFSRDGEYLDFLGQEGVGGTPFPFISGMYITAQDDCVVISTTGLGWTVFWFDPKGSLKSTTTVRRDSLPQAPGEDSLIPSLDGLSAAVDGSGIIIKIDYYREKVDAETRTHAGMEFASSVVWNLDRESGLYADPVEVPAFESQAALAAGEKPVPRSWDYAGSAAGRVFLSAADEDGQTYWAIFNPDDRSFKRFALKIEPDERQYMAFSLSPDGILAALLGTRYDARVVLWRFDRVIGGLGR